MSEETILNKEETTDKVEAEEVTGAAAESDAPTLVEVTPELSTEAPSFEKAEAKPPVESTEPFPEFQEPEEEYVFPDEEKPVEKVVHFSKEEGEFSREEWILSQIGKEHLMEYLTLEQKRNELDKQIKETREKRLFNAFELTLSLAAVVAVVFLLRDNPTILVNILYIAGIIAGLWLWKNPREKK